LPSFIGVGAYKMTLNIKANSKFTSSFLSITMRNQMTQDHCRVIHLLSDKLLIKSLVMRMKTKFNFFKNLFRWQL